MSSKFDYTIEHDRVKGTLLGCLKKIRFDQVSHDCVVTPNQQYRVFSIGRNSNYFQKKPAPKQLGAGLMRDFYETENFLLSNLSLFLDSPPLKRFMELTVFHNCQNVVSILK